MKPTHIVLTWPSQNFEILFRASDGMMIGERKDVTVIFGENPNGNATDPNRKQSRVFLETDEMYQGQKWNWFGSRFLRNVVAKQDMERIGIADQPVIEERIQEGSVILASGSLELASNGGTVRPVGRKVQ
jgi:hypothetical protein